MRRPLLVFVAALALLSALVGAQAPVAPGFVIQLFDNNGIPANGARLCTYLAGTTTPQVTYSDTALSVTNPQPIVLNAAGRPSVSSVEIGIYPPAVNLKYVLYTAASTTTDCVTGTMAAIWTRDNVPSISELLLSTVLASGTPDNTTFLRGDSGGRTWAKPWTVVVSNATGTLNNFAPGIVGPTVVKMTNASLATITGMTGTLYDGCLVEIEADGNGEVDLANLNGGSTSANQFENAVTSASTPLAAGPASAGIAGGTALYRYDGTVSHWRLVSHVQGPPITPTFSAGNFIASTSGTWTVVSGNVTTLTYVLVGRMLTVTWYIPSTSVTQSGGQPTALTIQSAAYGGFTNAMNYALPVVYNDNGTGQTIGFAVPPSPSGGTSVNVLKITSGQWASSTTNTNVFGQVTFQVQ